MPPAGSLTIIATLRLPASDPVRGGRLMALWRT
jgi:hypothetical protein